MVPTVNRLLFQKSYKFLGFDSRNLIIFLDFRGKIPTFAAENDDAMIHRIIEKNILPLLNTSKAIVIMGARQVGKSTLLDYLFGNRHDVKWLNGDEPDTQSILTNISSSRLRAIIGENRFLVIDEAQKIPDIGLKMKLVTDQIKSVQVVATGSSSFELASKVNESLAGRKREFLMFPLTFKEMVEHTDLQEELRMLPHRLVYGSYPEVVNSPGQENAVLKELMDSYLYKDILSLENINKPDKVVMLLKALSLQIGNQVSYNEIGSLIGLDTKTVERYVDVLEKSFVVFRLGSFSRNLRNELKRSRKIYFWDLGMRNAVIGNLAQVENRSDVGALWENYVISERMKLLSYRGSFAQKWFWRTQQQSEIDYIEEENGVISAYECKWNVNKGRTKCPNAFEKNYPEAKFTVITPDNVEDFLM